MKGIRATRSVLTGVGAFVATSAVIVTFTVSNARPPTPAANTPQPPAGPATAAQPSNPTSDAGNTGTPVEPSDEPHPATAAPGSSDGSQGRTPSPGARDADPSFRTLLGSDVTGPLDDIVQAPLLDLPEVGLGR